MKLVPSLENTLNKKVAKKIKNYFKLQDLDKTYLSNPFTLDNVISENKLHAVFMR